MCIYKISISKEDVEEKLGELGKNILRDYAFYGDTDICTSSSGLDIEYIKDQIQDDICFNCDGKYCNDCIPNVTNEMIKNYVEDTYKIKIEKDAYYLIGYSNCGYGGESDIKDDTSVIIGDLLSKYNMARQIHKGDWM